MWYRRDGRTGIEAWTLYPSTDTRNTAPGFCRCPENGGGLRWSRWWLRVHTLYTRTIAHLPTQRTFQSSHRMTLGLQIATRTCCQPPTFYKTAVPRPDDAEYKRNVICRSILVDRKHETDRVQMLSNCLACVFLLEYSFFLLTLSKEGE